MNDKSKYTTLNTNCSQEIEDAIDFEFYKALFEPVRSEIMKYLAINGAKSIKEIAENFTQDRSVISRHLELMNRYEIVTKTKQGRSTIYEINSEFIIGKFETTTSKLKDLIEN
jgi:DNA-binding transcriptional ArsR family regulator